MSFEQILARTCNSSETTDNTIGDRHITCRYGDVQGLLTGIDKFLAGSGIAPEACVAVECPNTVAGALLLLSLFRQGNSVVLVPPTVNQEETKPVPNFCRHRFTVAPSTQSAGVPFDPSASLRVEINPRHNGGFVSQGKLFLRTSGSMGASKIVVHSFEKLLGNAGNVVRKYGFSAQSRAAIPVPIAHMYGFGAEFLPSLLVGAAMDLQEKTNLLKYLDREKRFQPNIAFVTPAICDMLLKGYRKPRTDYQAFVTSGQRISEELFRSFDPMVSGKLINQYGSTEMGAISACDPDNTVTDRAGTIGSPMKGVELRIDNGELYCRHPYGFEGYLDEEGQCLKQAAADDWYRTGDLAATDPAGRIVVLGRADESVNRSGYLVHLSDIEQIFEKLDAAGQVAVVAAKGESRHGQSIVAFCVLKEGHVLNGTELRTLCFDLLPHYARPDEVRVLDRMPLLASGKVDRQALTRLAG